MDNELLVRLKFIFRIGRRHRQRHKEDSSKGCVRGSMKEKMKTVRGQACYSDWTLVLRASNQARSQK